MEKQSKRTSNKVEDVKRCCRGAQSRMDEYFSVSDSDEEDLGSKEHYLQGHTGGAGGRAIDPPGEGREGGRVQMGRDSPGCSLLARKGGSYPCWNCPGGLSFSECKRLRGELS